MARPMKSLVVVALLGVACGHSRPHDNSDGGGGGDDAATIVDAKGGGGDGGGGRGDGGSDGSGSDGGSGSGDAAGGGSPCGLAVCSFGYSSGTNGAALAVAVDAQRNVYVAGLSESDLVFGGHTLFQVGMRDAFLVSFAADGSFRWGKRFGHGTTLAGAYGIALDEAANIYITGGITGPIDFGGGPVGTEGMFVASFDHNGNYRWARGDGGTLGALHLAVAGGRVFALGEFINTIAFGSTTLTSAGNQDVVVAAFDASNGAFQWARAMGGPFTDQEGNIGATSGAIVFSMSGAAVGDGEQLVSWTAAGADRWAKPLPAAIDLAGLAVDSAGASYLAGMHVGGTDVPPGAQQQPGGDNRYIHAFNASGASRWSWTLSESPAYSWEAVPFTRATFDAAGNVLLAGTFDGTLYTGSAALSPGNDTIFLATFAPSGTPVGSRLIDDHDTVAEEWVQDAAVDSAGVTYVVGQYLGQPNFGDGKLPFASEGGVLIVRVAP
jgi:hypothetical protein